MITQQDFYRSKRWQKFRQVVIEERTQPDGFVYCAACGQPIVKKYDMVLDHIQELDDINVNDATVALNPENIQILHFRCHNEKHHRFGAGQIGQRAPRKEVHIIYGSPCSGKTSYVREIAGPDDIVVDMDSIWEMIGINERYTKPNALKSVVFEIRDKLYDIIKYRSGKWASAWIITGGALAGDRERLMQRTGADDMVYIDTPEDECLARAEARAKTKEEAQQWRQYICDFWEQYQPEIPKE